MLHFFSFNKKLVVFMNGKFLLFFSKFILLNLSSKKWVHYSRSDRNVSNIVRGIFIYWDEIPETHLYAPTKSGQIFSNIKSIREIHFALLIIWPSKVTLVAFSKCVWGAVEERMIFGHFGAGCEVQFDVW